MGHHPKPSDAEWEDFLRARTGSTDAEPRHTDQGEPRGAGTTIVQWLAEHPLPQRLERSSEEVEADVTAARQGWV
jgi:hypothetical protein